MLCQGCGADMGNFYHFPGSNEGFSYCGACNNRYAAYEEQERLQKIKDKEDSWNRLVAKYGFDTACEIMADSG